MVYFADRDKNTFPFCPLSPQSILMELEVLMVRVAMQLMAGHMYKAATSTRKFLKMSHWLLKVRAQPPNTATGTKCRYVPLRFVRGGLVGSSTSSNHFFSFS